MVQLALGLPGVTRQQQLALLIPEVSPVLSCGGLQGESVADIEIPDCNLAAAASHLILEGKVLTADMFVGSRRSQMPALGWLL